METRDQQLFIDNVQLRVTQLIRTHVWDGIDDGRRHEWFGQFTQQKCGLLAACLLDNLIYRSKHQVLALFKAAFTCDRLVSATAESDLAIIEGLQQNTDPGIRLVPVISMDQPPTKSGPYMLRILARELGFRDRWMIWPEQLPKVPASVHTIIVIDDFCGSGKQFRERFLDTTHYQNFRAEHSTCRVVYIAAAAHADGIESIREDASGIEVIAGEVLSSEHHFFNGSILNQYNDSTLREELERQHNVMIDGLAMGGRVGPLGFSDQALTYGFAHGTPNNSLSLLWCPVNGWTPLLER
jgi:hypothetical protein